MSTPCSLTYPAVLQPELYSSDLSEEELIDKDLDIDSNPNYSQHLLDYDRLADVLGTLRH